MCVMSNRPVNMFSALLFLCGSVSRVVAFNFSPANLPVFNDYLVEVPTAYNVSNTELINGIPDTSYWTSSYISGVNNHEYLLISHAFINVSSTVPGFYRASIFDITEKAHYDWLVPVFYSGIPATTLNMTFEKFQFLIDSPDAVSTLHTSSSSDGLGYDITAVGSHPVFFNFGSGAFYAGNGAQNEWAIPSMKTTGSLTVNNKRVEIDPHRSFTWYDRQWGPGVLDTGNWTWFELHLDSGVKASIWNWDNADPAARKRAATFQFPDGSHYVTAINFTQNYARSYHSTVFDFLYPLDWKLEWGAGNCLRISSISPDQEIKGLNAQSTAYEGFSTVHGVAFGERVTGYGVVEMVDLRPPQK